MTTTHLGLDEREGGSGVYKARRSGEQEEGIEVRMRGRSAKGALDCVRSHMRAHGSNLFFASDGLYWKPAKAELKLGAGYRIVLRSKLTS